MCRGYPSQTEVDKLSKLLSGSDREVRSNVRSLLHTDLGAQLPLHISLSRPVMLLTAQRRPFLDQVEKAIRDADVRP